LRRWGAAWLPGQRGRWLLRIEDVDTPRSVPGAADGILRTLARFGFEWDGPVVWQSARTSATGGLRAPALPGGVRLRLHPQGDGRLGPGPDGTALSGHLPRWPAAGAQARAWRLRVEPGVVSFDDAVQGPVEEDVAADVGDFVLLRADGLFAYQLAVVVDDAEAGVTEVVRGADLLDSTPARSCSSAARPSHAALRPPAGGEQRGRREALQADPGPGGGGRPAPAGAGGCAGFSRAGAPGQLVDASLDALWAWARANWSMDRVPRQRLVPAPRYG
jgi:glutamyl-Q tRNA(Asp) synthetase